MSFKLNFPLIAALIFVSLQTFGQCPTNIDFETGTTSNWSYYAGSCCPVAVSPSPALPNRMSITSGTGVDPYGLFPVVAPGGGSHSLKLGNDSVSNHAERARYYVHVPTGATYSLIYRYAVVLSDPSHTSTMQPAMTIVASDSATGTPVPCASYSYTATSSLPGFLMSGAGGGPVYYKPWTMGNMKFPGLGGHTIAIDFTTNDCGFSGHFGYGYVDMSCGLFMNEIITCAGTVSLSGPDGYQSYVWKDSATFSTTYGTSQLVVVTTPTVATTYAVIVTPYVGYGCVDTLYTRVIVPAPITGPGTVCIGGTATMTNPVPGGAWTSGSTGIAIIGGSSGIITGMAAGTTTITYTIGGTCVSTMAVTVTPCPSLSAPFSNKDEALTIFPNPNKGELMVNLSSAINATAIITITNLIGVKVDEFRINTNENTRLKIAYPAGIYILSTNTSQGRLVERLVIME